MKWKPTKRNPRIEDRSGQPGPKGGGGGLGFPTGSGGGLPIPTGGGKMGIGTIILIVVIFFVLKSCGGGDDGGFNVPSLPSDQSQVPANTTGTDEPAGVDPQANSKEFVNFVFTDIDGFWTKQFQTSGKQLTPPGLVLFSQGVDTGCGQASSATGPFYCPPDQKIYIDLTFFNELDKRFKAPGDFAQAYVIAHEYGHHIQQQLGIEQKVSEETQSNPDDANELSVRLELQADCFAGLWGKGAFDAGVLEDGDLDEGLTAAAAVGDDRIQEQTQGRVDPETFTHGTSEQRMKWFRAGFDSGDISKCDTFSVDSV